jgi:hypothetical protein
MFDCAPLGAQLCSSVDGAHLQQFTLLESPDRNGYRLLIANESVAQSAELQSLLDQLTRDLMIHVANHAPDRVFIHAGVIGWQERALLLPGTSFAGKTTLVAELVRAGATYYSDEYAVLDQHGRVHPYPRDLQMRNPGSSTQSAVPVQQLNGASGIAPLRVSHVIFTEYTPSGIWQPEPVSPGMAVLELLRHTIPVQRTPARVMATLAKMIETANVVRSQRGEAREVAPTLLSLAAVRSIA